MAEDTSTDRTVRPMQDVFLLCSEIVCAKFKLSQPIRSRNVMKVNTWHVMTLTFDPLTFQVCALVLRGYSP